MMTTRTRKHRREVEFRKKEIWRKRQGERERERKDTHSFLVWVKQKEMHFIVSFVFDMWGLLTGGREGERDGRIPREGEMREYMFV